MKTFKHIISYACDKNCSYCINEILVHNERQCKDISEIVKSYRKFKNEGYEHIMISGGEPVVNKMFPSILMWAHRIFKKVSIITAHHTALSMSNINSFADDVLFSFHLEYQKKWYEKVEIIKPVYASMVVESFLEMQKMWEEPLLTLKSLGYSGATIRECYPDGVKLPKHILVPNDFSLRTHTKDNCVKENVLLLPDLSTTTEKEFS